MMTSKIKLKEDRKMRKSLIAFLSIAVAVLTGCTALPTGAPQSQPSTTATSTSQTISPKNISKLWGRQLNREIQGGGLGMAGIWVQITPTFDESVYDASFMSPPTSVFFSEWIGHARLTVFSDSIQVKWDSGNITEGYYKPNQLDFPGCEDELIVAAEILNYGGCTFDSEERPGDMEPLARSNILGRTLLGEKGYSLRIDKSNGTDELGFDHYEGSMYLNAQLIYSYEVVDYGTGILEFVFADGSAILARTSLVEQVSYEFSIYFDCSGRKPWGVTEVCTFSSN